MSYSPVGCSHGVAWSEECKECNKVSLRQELHSISSDCHHVAEELKKQPGICSDPRMVIDLYETIERLANVMLHDKQLDIKS